MSDAPTIGHNRAQPPTPEQVRAWLDDTTELLRKRGDEIVLGIGRFLDAYAKGIPNGDVYAKAADLAGGKGAIAGWLKLCKAAHTSEKQPYLAAGREVDGYFAKMTTAIETGRATIQTLALAYSNEEDRIKRAAAQKAADEAAARARAAEAAALKSMDATALDQAAELARIAEQAEAATAAPIAEHARVTGNSGVTASVRSTWKFIPEESDLMALAKAVVAGTAPLQYLAFNETRLGIAVRSEKVRDVPGCVIREVQTFS